MLKDVETSKGLPSKELGTMCPTQRFNLRRIQRHSQVAHRSSYLILVRLIIRENVEVE